MKVLYFAWFRDRIGMAEEEIETSLVILLVAARDTPPRLRT